MLARVVTGILALGVVIAGITLWRVTATSRGGWIRHARWAVAALAAYGAFSFAYAAVIGIPVHDALRGHGLLQFMPYVLRGAFIGGLVVLPLGWVASIVLVSMPRFREGSPRPPWYQAVALTACVALVIAPLETSGPRAKSLDTQARITLLDRSLRALEDGDRDMPRDAWDPDYVVRRVGRDPQRLFTWVRDNTFWIPYRGVLRGAVGVLMDRQGNSLDRAVLLATLLEKAGHTVRLAHAELARKQAIDLLPRLVSDREVAFAPERKRTGVEIDLRKVAASYQLDGRSISEAIKEQAAAFDRIQSELDSRVGDQTDRLLRTIDKPDIDAEWSRRFSDAITALSDHWWVQQKQEEKWVDFDLLQDGGRSSVGLTAAKDTSAIKDLAASLHHVITIRVIGEQWSSGQLIERKSLEQALRPSDLIGQPIALQFWPLDWISDSGENRTPKGDFRRSVREERVWVAALLVGKNVITHGALLANGEDPTAAVKGGPMSGLASAFADSMSNNGQVGIHQRQLSAVWIEYEISGPGKQPRTIRRSVFDLIGSASRASGLPKLAMSDAKELIRGLALTMHTEILPLACRFAPGYLMHMAAQSLLGNHELIRAAIRGNFAPYTPVGDTLFERSTPVVSSLYSLAAARMEWSRDAGSLFIDEPGLLTKHTYLATSGNELLYARATDIVVNNIGVSLAVHDGFRARLSQGVLDTNAESMFEPVADTFGNAGDAFAKSRSWVRVADASQAGRLRLPEDVRRSIGEEVSVGYEVVAPESLITMPHEPFAGWWSIDRATGNALGIGANGWGAVAVEESRDTKRAVDWAPPFNAFMRRFTEGFVSGLGFCLATELLTVRKTEGIWMGEALDIHIERIGQDCGPGAVLSGVVSAVLPLFVLTFKGAYIQLTGRFARWARPAEGLAEKGFKGTPYGEPGEPPKGVGPGPKGEPGGGPGQVGGSGPESGGPEPSGSNGPPSDDPCNIPEGSEEPAPTERPDSNVTQGQKEPPVNPPPEAEGPIQPSEQMREAVDNLWAANKANEDAATQSRKALGDVVRYRVNKPSIADRTGGDPSKFDPAEYARLQKIYQDLQKLTDLRYNEWLQAQQALKDAQQALARARGAAGRGGLACGWGQRPQPQLAAGPANQASPGQPANPAAGGGDPALDPTQPQLSPPGDPALNPTQPQLSSPGDPALDPTQPQLSPPGDPALNPTQPQVASTVDPALNSTQPQQQVAPPTQRSPNLAQGSSGPSDEPIPPTEPGPPPTRGGPPPSSSGGPPTLRSPQTPASPGQTTLLGLGGAMGALGGK